MGKVVGAQTNSTTESRLVNRTKVQIEGCKRDSRSSTCDRQGSGAAVTLVAVRVDDAVPSGHAMDRATIRRKKTGTLARFNLADDRIGLTTGEYTESQASFCSLAVVDGHAD
jgi:hypothetical protein